MCLSPYGNVTVVTEVVDRSRRGGEPSTFGSSTSQIGGYIYCTGTVREWWENGTLFEGRECDTQCQLLVDSGAAVSLIPLPLWHTKGSSSKLELRRTGHCQKLTSLDSSRLQLLGQADIVVRIGH